MNRGGLIAVSMLFAAAANAEADTIFSTKVQSGFNGYTQPNDPTHTSAPISATPFDFSGQTQLSSIQSISITLTVIDGDTGLGPNGINDTPFPPDGNNHGDDDDFVNTLHLRLDGIDTGQNLLLNGFNNYDPNFPLAPKDFVTATITGSPANMAAILTALQDGFLTATVFDAGFSNTTLNGYQNGFRIPDRSFDGSSAILTTLSITGVAVPEPNTWVCIIAGVAPLAAVKRWLGALAR